MPQLEIDIVALAEPESQIDPKFQTAFKYTRITAKAMREALMTKKGWQHGVNLPKERFVPIYLCIPWYHWLAAEISISKSPVSIFITY
jgi:hypothetical protein